jgi:hypothetical protein
MVPFKGEKDVCEEVEKQGKNKDVAERMDHYKINKKCPIAKVSSVCLSQVHTCFCAHYSNWLLPDGGEKQSSWRQLVSDITN